MDTLLAKIECYGNSKTFDFQQICKQVLDKPRDQRRLDGELLNFCHTNRRAFEFLDVNVDIDGHGNTLRMQIGANQYIGAISLKSQRSGLPLRELQVIPRFSHASKDALADAISLIGMLDNSVKPERLLDAPLLLPNALRVLPYYEAAKFIQVMGKALQTPWQKFCSEHRVHPYPKASTDWQEYTKRAVNPHLSLVFPSRDNVITVNHEEWQQLAYVFDIAANIINNPAVPPSMKAHIRPINDFVSRRLSAIPRTPVRLGISLHASDPERIKRLKELARVVIGLENPQAFSWRIDMSELFERYVQHVFTQACRPLGQKLIANERFVTRDRTPRWGLKHLEPDFILTYGGEAWLVGDAKYKPHLFNHGVAGENLKNSHRADLHQVFAYAGFLPDSRKQACLCYPASRFETQKIVYRAQVTGNETELWLIGIPFSVAGLPTAIADVRNLLAAMRLRGSGE